MEKQKDKVKDPTFKDKLNKIAQDYIIYILMALISANGSYLGYKEYSEEEKQEALKEEIIDVVTKDLTSYLDSARNISFSVNMEKALMSSEVWATVLSSGFIDEFASRREKNLTTIVEAKFEEIDSIQDAQRNSIGKISGIRNDRFEIILGQMIKDYMKKNEVRVLELDAF